MAKKKTTKKKTTKTTKKKAGKKRVPVKTSGAATPDEPESGPRGWFVPQLEGTYSRLAPSAGAAEPVASGMASVRLTRSHLQGGASVLSQAGTRHWSDVLAEYKRRKATAVAAAVAVDAAAAVALRAGVAPAAPVVPGGRNWRPLGPRVVLNGQTVGQNPVAGRVGGVAIAPGGDTVYVSTAAGGVFRSDDAGASWRSLMDGFDVDPTDFASASLACGAIAIDPADPDRVYVGTGEGDTHEMFRRRVVSALPAYRGIGPIRTDDGGVTWVTEQSAVGSPDLAGDAFFALAVDPRDRENVVGATTLGVFQRVPAAAAGNFEWVRRRIDVHSSVVVASAGNTTRFFVAKWGKGVSHSTTGESWMTTGTGFPSTDVGRIALGVQPDNPNLVYAFVAKRGGGLRGVYRLDSMGGSWKRVSGVPDVLPGSQGDYDLTISVDPLDANLIYLGGDRGGAPPWPASVWRCEIKSSGASYAVDDSASIGRHAHADVHVLTHTPGNPDELWCGNDGGLFLNRNPKGTGQFASRNDGLSCLCSNFIAQHPTDPNILFTGLQDNGTAHTASGPTWSHVSGGDGGYCLINWTDTDQVLVFANGRVYRSTTGGDTHNAWSKRWDFTWATMTQPIVGLPYDPANPADGDRVAVGAGQDVFLSDDFAETWPMQFTLPSGSGNVFALAFASPTRLFVGTVRGRVFRAERSGDTWTTTRIDNVAAGPLGLSGLITDVAVDWSDANHESIYIAFGGMGDARRVWRFDGTQWEPRSGALGTDLLDVEHNALVVDPEAPQNVYVGADIGVWHSDDQGQTWNPLQNGLPDAPVFDLQIHPTQRLLRAATHGRGLYEIRIF